MIIQFMLENILIILNKLKENLYGQMGKFLLENLKIMNQMEMDILNIIIKDIMKFLIMENYCRMINQFYIKIKFGKKEIIINSNVNMNDIL